MASIKGPEKTAWLQLIQSNTTVHGKLQSFFTRFLHFTEMHLLEDHTIPWAKEWHVGLTSLENKGPNQYMPVLQRTHHSMPDKVQQLLSIMKEKLLFIAPHNVRQSHSRLVTKHINIRRYSRAGRYSVLTFSTFDRCQKKNCGYKPMLISISTFSSLYEQTFMSAF